MKAMVMYDSLYGNTERIAVAINAGVMGEQVVAPPEGFFVLGTEGRLFDGEIDRAKDWASTVVKAVV